MLLEVEFYFFCKYSMPSALCFDCDDFFTLEDVSAMANVLLSAPFVPSSSASDMSKLLGKLILDMVDKGVVMGLSPITSARS
jgi:hypothetical protein